jgi:hypothetical protein
MVVCTRRDSYWGYRRRDLLVYCGTRNCCRQFFLFELFSREGDAISGRRRCTCCTISELQFLGRVQRFWISVVLVGSVRRCAIREGLSLDREGTLLCRQVSRTVFEVLCFVGGHPGLYTVESSEVW